MKGMKKEHVLTMAIVLTVALLPAITHAAGVNGSSGVADSFKSVAETLSQMASGYVGKSIAIVGGLTGLLFGAATGKILPAITGLTIGLAGTLGTSLTNSLYTATI